VTGGASPPSFRMTSAIAARIAVSFDSASFVADASSSVDASFANGPVRKTQGSAAQTTSINPVITCFGESRFHNGTRRLMCRFTGNTTRSVGSGRAGGTGSSKGRGTHWTSQGKRGGQTYGRWCTWSLPGRCSRPETKFYRTTVT
jgi:hypothetical protein